MARNCVNNQYAFQEFLLECPFDEIQTEKYKVDHWEELPDHHVEYNLLDYSEGFIRRAIALTQLDHIIDTEDDFLRFVNDHRWIDELVIVDDRPQYDNLILADYSSNTLKAYLYRINNAGISCVVARKQKE